MTVSLSSALGLALFAGVAVGLGSGAGAAKWGPLGEAGITAPAAACRGQMRLWRFYKFVDWDVEPMDIDHCAVTLQRGQLAPEREIQVRGDGSLRLDHSDFRKLYVSDSKFVEEKGPYFQSNHYSVVTLDDGSVLTLDGGDFDEVVVGKVRQVTVRDASVHDLRILDSDVVVALDHTRVEELKSGGAIDVTASKGSSVNVTNVSAGTFELLSSTAGAVEIGSAATLTAEHSTAGELTLAGTANFVDSHVNGRLTIRTNGHLISRDSTFDCERVLEFPVLVTGAPELEALLTQEEVRARTQAALDEARAADWAFDARWGDSACDDVYPCFEAAGVQSGSVLQGHVSIALGADGKATSAVMDEGDAPESVRACLASRGRTRHLDQFPGPPSHLRCAFAGTFYRSGVDPKKRDYHALSSIARDPASSP